MEPFDEQLKRAMTRRFVVTSKTRSGRCEARGYDFEGDASAEARFLRSLGSTDVEVTDQELARVDDPSDDEGEFHFESRGLGGRR